MSCLSSCGSSMPSMSGGGISDNPEVDAFLKNGGKKPAAKKPAAKKPAAKKPAAKKPAKK